MTLGSVRYMLEEKRRETVVAIRGWRLWRDEGSVWMKRYSEGLRGRHVQWPRIPLFSRLLLLLPLPLLLQ
jgi:hypothetical protein